MHADETSWGLNSLWAFLSEKARLLVFGCRKDGETLAQLLPKDSFVGILMREDAAVYQGFPPVFFRVSSVYDRLDGGLSLCSEL